MKKNKLIKKRGHRCEQCGLSEWLNKPIPLERHHKSPPSEKEEDLRLYCPNCHALTTNYRGKGIKTVNSISDKKFKEAAMNSKNIRGLLISLGLVAKGGNYATSKTRLQKLGLYEKFRPRSFAKICINCGIEFWSKGKFCDTTCSNRYNQSSLGKTKIAWPSCSIIEKMVKSMGYSATGRQLGVSDNAVRKRIKRHYDSVAKLARHEIANLAIVSSTLT